MKSNTYVLEVEKKRSPMGKASMIEAYQNIQKYRHTAAEVYKFNSAPGKQIASLRQDLKKAQETMRLKLVALKYKLNVAYDPSNRKAILEEIRGKVRHLRESYKQTHQDRLDKNGWDKYGMTHLKNGDVLKAYHKIILGTHKKPISTERHIGIEIECFLPTGSDYEAFLPFKKWLNLGTDGSITPPEGMQGAEMRILATENSFQGRITALCEVLSRIGAGVNASCGLHIHLDMRAFDPNEIKKRFANLVRMQNWLFSLVPPSRRENTFCRKTHGLDPYTSRNRYRAINPCALNEHNTIEVRLHSGTTNAEKIIHWVNLLLAITNAAEVKRPPRTVQGLAERLSLTPELTSYVESRRTMFTNNVENEQEGLQCANS